MKNFYGFTYKLNTKQNPVESDYDVILKLLRSKGDVTDFVYETRTKNGKNTALHIHGVIDFNRKNPYFKTLIPKGFHSHFEEIYDSKTWLRYINKNVKQLEDELPTDCHPQPDSPTNDYFRTNYVFGTDEIYLT